MSLQDNIIIQSSTSERKRSDILKSRCTFIRINTAGRESSTMGGSPTRCSARSGCRITRLPAASDVQRRCPLTARSQLNIMNCNNRITRIHRVSWGEKPWTEKSTSKATCPTIFSSSTSCARRSRADSGAPGHQIPGEQELCELYGVSRTVVRQALRELELDGMITRRKGKGTFIAPPKISEGLVQKLTGFYQDMVERGLRPTTRCCTRTSCRPPRKLRAS